MTQLYILKSSVLNHLKGLKHQFLFLVCGPPPTAYDPKHPFGTGVISFPKGDRFPQGSTPNHLQPPQQDGTVILFFLNMYFQNCGLACNITLHYR